MNIFKNSVGRPSNETKKKRKMVIFSIAIIVLLFVASLSSFTIGKLKGEATLIGKEVYVIKDANLKSAPKMKSSGMIALVKGTKVKILDETKYYYYVEIDPEDEDNKVYYVEKYKGYVLKRRVVNRKILHDTDNELRVSEKTRVVMNAYKLYKYNEKNGSKVSFGYSYESNKRKTGYNLILNGKTRKDNKYYFDCSAFVTTVLNATYGMDFKKVYSTYMFYNEVKGKKIGDETSHFKVVDIVKTKGKKIELDNLQAGDIILGINKPVKLSTLSGNERKKYAKLYKNRDMNHIMLYTGDGKIIHSSGRDKNEKIRYNELTEDYYVLGKHFVHEIYVLRVNKDSIKTLRSIELDSSGTKFNLKNVD